MYGCNEVPAKAPGLLIRTVFAFNADLEIGIKKHTINVLIKDCVH
jgi:hypothetical protein